MLAKSLLLLALSAVVPSAIAAPSTVMAYESNPDALPPIMRKLPYCQRINSTSATVVVNASTPEIGKFTSPYSLVIWNATHTPYNATADPPIGFNETGSAPLATVPVPDFKIDVEASKRANTTLFSWSYVVNVPYGNELIGHICDADKKMILEYAMLGVWVDKGQGTCDQSTLAPLPFDPASMASKTGAASAFAFAPSFGLLALGAGVIGGLTAL